MGMPTKYKSQYCEQLIAHMTKGLSFESFAGLISVARQTVYNWRTSQKEFDQAYNIAVEKSRLFWETKGLEALHDRSINPTIWIYTMKCRFRAEWGDQIPEKPDESFSANDIKVLVEHMGLLNKADK